MLLFPEGLKALKQVAKQAGVDLKGAYLNLDGGFDSAHNRKCIFNAGLIPNIKERSYWIPGSYAPTWSEKRTSIFKAIEKEGLQGGTGDNNWVGRHQQIHDPGIQQESARDVCLGAFQEAHDPAPIGVTRTYPFLEVSSG